ncbi:hypothetical protein FQN50_000784 [Emmonsiellopsis sp. PD_5]|nr:hypothetical protein FQN50_000784 [Emmonsiellopsis sp. PD_5]
MAVLDHFEVTVEVDKETAQEYEADEDGTRPNEVVKYIESKAGATFGVRVNVKKGYAFDSDSLSVQLDIDGQYAGGAVTKKEEFLACPEYSYVLNGQKCREAGNCYKKPFKFVDAVVSENSKIVTPNSKIATIQVGIWRAKRRRPKKPTTSSTSFTPLGEISEKSTKGQAISHTASFAPKEAIKPFNFIDARFLGNNPIATFTFKYRSKKALQGLLIIPRTPSPVPLEDRPVEDLTVEEMRILIERQRREAAIKHEHAQAVKRERSDTASSVTRTPQHKKSRVASSLSAEESDSEVEITPAPNRGRRKIEVISLLDDD